MTENTQFEMDVLAMDTSSSERNFTVSFDYRLTRDKVRKKYYTISRIKFCWPWLLCFECG